MSKLEYFSMPKCLKCGVEAVLEDDNDGGCSDPECCGGAREWVNAVCKKCGIKEEIPGD